MERTLLYVVDEKVSEPIMRINGTIGEDVKGAIFQEELLYLDTLGKKRIQIHINSIGGSVYEGYSICSAILKTKTIVDTYNIGICASMAMNVYLVGRTRYWSDYAIGMVHNASGGEGNELEPINASIKKMIAARTGMDEAKVESMMAAETWMTATEAKEMGICSEIEETNELNIPRVKKTDDIQASFERIKSIINSATQPQPIQMKKVTAILDLNESASEEAIVKGIQSVQNVVTSKNEEITKLKNEAISNKTKMDDLNDKITKMTAEVDALKKEKADAENANNIVTAKATIKEAVTAGKIENKKESIEAWEAKATADLKGVKALLDAIPVNKKSGSTIVAEKAGEVGYSIALSMSEITQKAKAK